MYKVLIIDDEILAIHFLEHLIDWEEMGCRVVATATTASRAMALVKEIKPDIIFMDIKIPGADGIELSKKILQNIHNAEIIILTAYADFEYAQRALKIGVLDFLIKHELDERGLRETVEKAICEIRKKDEISDLMIEHWMKQGWEGKREYQIPEKIKKESNAYRILLIRKEKLFEDTCEIVMKDNLEKMNMILGCFQNEKKNLIVLIEVQADRSERSRREAYQTIAYMLLKEIRELGLGPVSGICSEEFFDLQDYSIRCQELKKMEEYFFYQSHKLLFPEEYEQLEIVESNWPENAEEKVLVLFMTKGKKIEEFLYRVFRTEKKDFLLKKRDIEPLRILEKVWKENQKEDFPVASLSELIKKEVDLQEVVQRSMDASMEKNSIAGIAVDYVHQHFGEDINSAIIADRLHVSDGYLRKIFKKEMGITLKEYILVYRIERAKQYLESGKYKISDITELCGFKTSQHFSTVFKHIVGMSPGAYISEKDKKIHL